MILQNMKGAFQIEIPEMELPNGGVSNQTAGFSLLPLCSHKLVSNPGNIVCARGHFKSSDLLFSHKSS